MKNIFILMLTMLFLSCKQSLRINTNVAKTVNEKLDTISAIQDYKSNSNLSDLFNSDLRVSYDNSDFDDSFAYGGISVDENGTIRISYRLAESSGPFFSITVSEKGFIENSKFQIAGDESPSSNQVSVKVDKLDFNRRPRVGESLCFYIEFHSKNWHFPKGNEQSSHFKIYGYINKVDEMSSTKSESR